jgi:hypothetical protein
MVPFQDGALVDTGLINPQWDFVVEIGSSSRCVENVPQVPVNGKPLAVDFDLSFSCLVTPCI